MKIADWNIEQLTGYKPKTTLYTDFSIAEVFGADSVEETFTRVSRDFAQDVVYFTELVMVLNWKIFEHFERKTEFANLYNDLWAEADEYACTHFTGDDLAYFYKTTDWGARCIDELNELLKNKSLYSSVILSSYRRRRLKGCQRHQLTTLHTHLMFSGDAQVFLSMTV